MKSPCRWKKAALLIPLAFLGLAAAGCQNTLRSRFNYRHQQAPAPTPQSHSPGVVQSAYPQTYQTNYHARRPAVPNIQLAQHTVPGGPMMGNPHGGPMMYGGPMMHGGPSPHGPGPFPTELEPVAQPPYRVSPPDILYIEAINLMPRAPYRLQPLDVINVQVPEASALPKQPIAGKYTVSPDGNVNLGFSYGSIRVAGLTTDECQNRIHKHLANIVNEPQVVIGLVSFRNIQQVRGEHLVRPDGSISLGSYGNLFVAGKTLRQIQFEVQQYLSRYVQNPKVSVDVFAYNSKKYYVIYDGGGYGQFVLSFPYTGYETVLDAVAKTSGLPPVASKKQIWVARPAPGRHCCSQILPVDWEAITEGGVTRTNWQLMPGDRVYVEADCYIRADNYMRKLLFPFERVLGIAFLGSSVSNSFNGRNNSGGGGF